MKTTVFACLLSLGVLFAPSAVLANPVTPLGDEPAPPPAKEDKGLTLKKRVEDLEKKLEAAAPCLDPKTCGRDKTPPPPPAPEKCAPGAVGCEQHGSEAACTVGIKVRLQYSQKLRAIPVQCAASVKQHAELDEKYATMWRAVIGDVKKLRDKRADQALTIVSELETVGDDVVRLYGLLYGNNPPPNPDAPGYIPLLARIDEITGRLPAIEKKIVALDAIVAGHTKQLREVSRITIGPEAGVRFRPGNNTLATLEMCARFRTHSDPDSVDLYAKLCGGIGMPLAGSWQGSPTYNGKLEAGVLIPAGDGQVAVGLYGRNSSTFARAPKNEKGAQSVEGGASVSYTWSAGRTAGFTVGFDAGYCSVADISGKGLLQNRKNFCGGAFFGGFLGAKLEKLVLDSPVSKIVSFPDSIDRDVFPRGVPQENLSEKRKKFRVR